MLRFEEPDETVAPTPPEDGRAEVDDVDATVEAPAEPESVTVDEGPTSAARVLELAAIAADQLVADAEKEAASMVATARAEADSILETSRKDAQQAAGEMVRRKEQQAAELAQERATTLAGLADEKLALEARIATLRQTHDDHRSQMRHHLTEQLALLDATLPDTSAPVVG